MEMILAGLLSWHFDRDILIRAIYSTSHSHLPPVVSTMSKSIHNKGQMTKCKKIIEISDTDGTYSFNDAHSLQTNSCCGKDI